MICRTTNHQYSGKYVKVGHFREEQFEVFSGSHQREDVQLVAAILVISYANSYSFNAFNIGSRPNDMLLAKDWFRKTYGELNDNAKIGKTSYIAYVPGLKYLFSFRNPPAILYEVEK